MLDALLGGLIPTFSIAVATAVVHLLRRRRAGGQSLYQRVQLIEQWLVGQPGNRWGWKATPGFIDEWPQFRDEVRSGMADLKKAVVDLKNR